MNNKIHILIAVFLSGIVHAQSNLISNPSFETGPGTPYCNPGAQIVDNDKQIDVNIDNWKDAETNHIPGGCEMYGSCRVTTGWVDYNTNTCFFSNPVPHLPGNNRYITMGSGSSNDPRTQGDGIRIDLKQVLQEGHTYKLTFRFAANATPAGLRIYLTKFNTHWGANPKNTQNQKLEISGIHTNYISSFVPSTWYSIERYFTVPPIYGVNQDHYNDLKNLVFFNDYADGLGANYCFLDDVALYDNGCCPQSMQYENTSSLPTITHVTKSIIAGYDAGIIGTSGNVNVLAGQRVTLRGESVSLLPGFNSVPNSVTVIQPDPCTSSSSPTLDPISTSILPNSFTPNGDGVNDKFCITAQGFSSYHIRIINRHGQIVFVGCNDVSDGAANNWANSINTNYQCMWDGKTNDGNCVSDGVYDYEIKLSNCSNMVEYGGVINITACRGVVQNPNLDFSADGTNLLIKGTLISPNPNNGIFNLQLKENATGEVFVYNNLGQQIHQQVLRSSNSQIDLSSQPKGIYFVKVQSADKMYAKKIVVQ